MDQKLTQIQLNKEPPEAAEVVNLDDLTRKILSRKDISDWAKADMLSSTLERFMALRPKIFGDGNTSNPIVPPNVSQPPTTPIRTKKPPKRRRQASPVPDEHLDVSKVTDDDHANDQIEGKLTYKPKRTRKVKDAPVLYTGTPLKERLRKTHKDSIKAPQKGAGLKKWIHIY